jgi:hypothetical protein
MLMRRTVLLATALVGSALAVAIYTLPAGGAAPRTGNRGGIGHGACEAERCQLITALDEACPCNGFQNHGQYTSCVAQFTRATASRKCRSRIIRCAAHSTCSRNGQVACDLPRGCTHKRSAQACENAGGIVRASGTCCPDCGITSTDGAFIRD